MTPNLPRNDDPAHELAIRRRYLTRLVGQIDRLSLLGSQSKDSDLRDIPLEEVYVALSTDYAISVKIQDYVVTNWWIESKKDHLLRQEAETRAEVSSDRRLKSDKIQWSNSPIFSRLINHYQSDLDARKTELKEAEGQGKRYYAHVRDGVYSAQIPLTVQDIATGCRHLFVLGDQGSGKSTFVHYLALCLAGAALENWTRKANIGQLRCWTHGYLIPIYIRLRVFVSSAYFPQQLNELPTLEHFWAFIANEILDDEMRTYKDTLENDLQEGRGLIILDGLDEIPYQPGNDTLQARQEQLKALIKNLYNNYDKSRIIVTCRPDVYEAWTLPNFDAVEINALDQAQRVELATNLFKANGTNFEEAQNRATQIEQVLQATFGDIVSCPLYMTSLAAMFATHKIEISSRNRGILYQRMITLLLDRWIKQAQGGESLLAMLGDITTSDLLNRIAALAYEVHSQGRANQMDQATEISLDLVLEYLLGIHQKNLALDLPGIIAYLSEYAGILASPGDKLGEPNFHFAHPIFQEFLAAHHILSLCDGTYEHVRELMLSQNQQWLMPALFVADAIRATDMVEYSIPALWKLVQDVMPKSQIADVESLTLDDKRGKLIWLCSRIVIEQEMYLREQSGFDHKNVENELVQWLVNLIEKPGILTPPERADCGRALGLMGDPREGVGLRQYDHLPDIRWGVPVLPGIYSVGDKKDKQVQIMVAYRLAQYPLTYEQFLAFAEASDHHDPELWHGFPETVRDYVGHDIEVRRFNQQVIRVKNHPADNVSWYQAVAFCRWLTRHYRHAGLISNNEEIRLPTEREWEIAARYSHNGIYTWGNTENPDNANTSDGVNIGGTTAVGLYPSGKNSELDLYDLSGNVWEWTLTEYDTGEDSYEMPVRRVLRGGSYAHPLISARTSARYNDLYPDHSHYYYGLRPLRTSIS